MNAPWKDVCGLMNWRSPLWKRIAGIPAKHIFLAWILLAVILVVTVGPINLRPTTPFGPNVERFAAFFVLGGVFSLTYPKSLVYVAVPLVVSCGLFEYAQHFMPGRHPEFSNFLIKIAGAGVGLAAGKILR